MKKARKESFSRNKKNMEITRQTAQTLHKNEINGAEEGRKPLESGSEATVFPDKILKFFDV
ncbi:MAG: hypothetical protein AB9882_10225 [Ignavibacteriaceae bacterium]